MVTLWPRSTRSPGKNTGVPSSWIPLSASTSPAKKQSPRRRPRQSLMERPRPRSTDMTAPSTRTMWDVEKIRKDFPVLSQSVNGKPLVYLDNSASSQVPQVVIDRGSKYLEEEHSNIHRGVHYLSQRATTAYEAAREKVKRFINAREAKECIFVRGCTEGINLVMHGYGRKFIGAGDEIIISAMEHHANIVPWQMLCEEKSARLRVIPMNDAGELLLDEYDALLNERTKFVAVTHVSNALGTINPIKKMIG